MEKGTSVFPIPDAFWVGTYRVSLGLFIPIGIDTDAVYRYSRSKDVPGYIFGS